VTLTCSGGSPPPDASEGRPTLYLPRLLPGDTVVAAGAPGMVAAVELLAAAGGATCYADPFLPARTPARWRDRLFAKLLRRSPHPAMAAT
jgi:3-phenylpropionate/trans-cinnamate dioxygenase ferredoxin reductase subunit